MGFFRSKKAQSTAEYAIVIALVIGAAIAMQVYVRRGMSGSLKYVTDRLKKDGTGTGQYEPYYNQTATTTTRDSATIYSSEQTSLGGQVDRQLGKTADGEKTTRASKSVMRDVSTKD